MFGVYFCIFEKNARDRQKARGVLLMVPHCVKQCAATHNTLEENQLNGAASASMARQKAVVLFSQTSTMATFLKI